EAQGEVGWAARLWGTAEVLREAAGTPMPPVYWAEYEQAVVAARMALGEEAFAAAWTLGRTTSLEHAISEVLRTAGQLPKSELATQLAPVRACGLCPDSVAA